MPDQRTPEEQLQPALLDRLTDDQPDKKLEPRMERVISKRRMREAVLRDLTWLFNTTRLDPDMDPVTLPYARKSVINFGLPALSGQTASSLDIDVAAYFATTDWSEFMGIRQAMLLQFMHVVESAGTAFAFPTRTVQLLPTPDQPQRPRS